MKRVQEVYPINNYEAIKWSKEVIGREYNLRGDQTKSHRRSQCDNLCNFNNFS